MLAFNSSVQERIQRCIHPAIDFDRLRVVGLDAVTVPPRHTKTQGLDAQGVDAPLASNSIGKK